MSREDRERWEARYAAQAAALATEPPSPFLREHASLFSGQVLDVAAGAGRNALFLARRGCSVHAVDLAFGGLRAATAEAQRSNLSLHGIQADLEDLSLPRSRYDGVINIRYLQRSLFPALRQTVRPGGILLFETFLVDQGRGGHPRNPAFLLERGELAATFADFDILVSEEGSFDDGAGTVFLGRLIARRPAVAAV
jgi:2-polyprenyl-3-methyl-5-hydroxy-6-metoxy-1,4-benzoquinol methylase